MKLEDVTAAIRPRSDWEAVDLGFAMVRRDFWRCLTVWCLATGLPTLLAIWLLWEHPLILLALFWWWRPAGSRMVLFELSRRLFGEAPRWRDVWREIPRAWTHRFFHRYILLRLSPWLPVTIAVESLEGLRGKAYKQRAAQISRRGEGVSFWVYLMGDLMTAWLGIGMLYLLLAFIPEGQDGAWQSALQTFDITQPREIPLLILRTLVFCMMASMILCDIFLTGAGFGIYINNRTWLEGWDVELEFRRLGRRLTNTGLGILVALATFALAIPQSLANQSSPQERIEQIKEAPEFEVHTVTDRIPKNRRWGSCSSSGDGASVSLSIQGLFTLVIYAAIAALIALLAWLVWTRRHLFNMPGRRRKKSRGKPHARVVMGMEVTPESLPDDVPTTALHLWESGRHHEAMALLYRAAIAAIVTRHHIEIEESDTEGDCLRRVEAAATTHAADWPGFFKKLTSMWSAHAYAREPLDDASVRHLCANWPFTERRPGS